MPSVVQITNVQYIKKIMLFVHVSGYPSIPT